MEEAKAQPIRGFMLSTEHVQYVLDELAAFDRGRTPGGLQVRMPSVDAVFQNQLMSRPTILPNNQPGLQRGFWESDSLVEQPLRELLEAELSKLRNVPEEDKDWHPGSDKQVLDLVHPSM